MILKNFIVLEGLDGSGTTTQLKELAKNLENSYATCEPTDGHIGKLIKRILKKEICVDPLTLAYLFSADRNEHLYSVEGIEERCNNGQLVISDRYLFSSLAYQSLYCDFEDILLLNEKFPLPEIVFFINTDPSLCLRRIQNRSQVNEIFDSLEIQKNVLSNYLKSFDLLKEKGLKILNIDGSLTVEKILEIELSYIKNR
ncbi:MAG TPA: dTMP kinase [Spirochaetota bacterium]|jgi:dTMP kinase|nr:MAG: Thymidylate kinase [Spirochaetes bacterium ADurb.Bin133]HNZ26341.1 dTMP kinase [Spirochaetota bacterium]HOF01229.1 dTMP kinase [Spirochaetota bacterium]HOS32721.1 dTMP kinase [Spirochaetota bacterium]HOS54623.1 dTMP kinase [Spirochaetota bacterium]